MDSQPLVACCWFQTNQKEDIHHQQQRLPRFVVYWKKWKWEWQRMQTVVEHLQKTSKNGIQYWRHKLRDCSWFQRPPFSKMLFWTFLQGTSPIPKSSHSVLSSITVKRSQAKISAFPRSETETPVRDQDVWCPRIVSLNHGWFPGWSW